MLSSGAPLAILILITHRGDCRDPEAKLQELLHHHLPHLLQARQQGVDQKDLLTENVKDEFGVTLSGMMGALAEIQKKGDSMLAGIRRQRQILGELETRAAEAERRRQEEEVRILQLEDDRQQLETQMKELRGEKEKITRMRSGLEPLLNQVSTQKANL